MQGRTCKKYGNKAGMKSILELPYSGTQQKRRLGRLHYICCITHFFATDVCSLPCLSFPPCSRVGQPQDAYHPCLASILFTGSSLHYFNFYRKLFTRSIVHPSIYASFSTIQLKFLPLMDQLMECFIFSVTLATSYALEHTKKEVT